MTPSPPCVGETECALVERYCASKDSRLSPRVIHPYVLLARPFEAAPQNASFSSAEGSILSVLVLIVRSCQHVPVSNQVHASRVRLFVVLVPGCLPAIRVSALDRVSYPVFCICLRNSWVYGCTLCVFVQIPDRSALSQCTCLRSPVSLNRLPTSLRFLLCRTTGNPNGARLGVA